MSQFPTFPGMPPMPGSSQSTTGGMNQSSSSGASSFVNNPFVTKQFGGLLGMLKNQIQSRLAGSRMGMGPGYLEGQTRAINQSFNPQALGMDNAMAARGMFGGPGHQAALGALESGRGGAIANMRMQIPELLRQRQAQDMGLAQGLISDFGKGSAGSGTTSQNTSGMSVGSQFGLQGADPTSLIMGQLGGMQQPQTQSPLMSGAGSLAEMLSFLQGQGAFGGGGGGGGGAPQPGPWASGYVFPGQ